VCVCVCVFLCVCVRVRVCVRVAPPTHTKLACAKPHKSNCVNSSIAAILELSSKSSLAAEFGLLQPAAG
jgi:hypothetical protein